MAPSAIGTSYCLPVRLSVMVSVSAIRTRNPGLGVGVGVRVAVGRGKRLSGDAITPVGPSRQILVPASLAAEGTPLLALRMPAAQRAQRGVVHPIRSEEHTSELQSQSK